MTKVRCTVTQLAEHTVVALTPDGEEVTVYRGNLQRYQRNAAWDWETITIGTHVLGTIVEPDRVKMRRRLIEVLIVEP